MQHDSDKTPPHHPAYGIDITDAAINIIIRSCNLGPVENLRISRLSHRQSYNNRIYIIHMEPEDTNPKSYVLKVCGRFFGQAKVENEVSCLLLLKQYCPDTPVPSVIAWSHDGSHITRSDENGRSTDMKLQGTSEGHQTPAWILMTFLPGSPIDPPTLSVSEMTDISSQIGNCIVSWRQNIPRSRTSANLHFQPHAGEAPNIGLYQTCAADRQDMYVYGSVGTGNNFAAPVRSLLEYWRAELDWQVNLLSTKVVYLPNAEPLIPSLHQLLEVILPKLSLFADPVDPAFIFTHTDLFPRNVLVHGNPPQLSGIVDFEFSGFFPPMEEFVQDWLPEDDDSQWPPTMYKLILDELERGGEATPSNLNIRADKEIRLLNVLRNYIAPWWIGTSDEEDEQERVQELLYARQKVQAAIAELVGLAETVL